MANPNCLANIESSVSSEIQKGPLSQRRQQFLTGRNPIKTVGGVTSTSKVVGGLTCVSLDSLLAANFFTRPK